MGWVDVEYTIHCIGKHLWALLPYAFVSADNNNNNHCASDSIACCATLGHQNLSMFIFLSSFVAVGTAGDMCSYFFIFVCPMAIVKQRNKKKFLISA